jgi:rhodanese-related sulfurtransferase
MRCLREDSDWAEIIFPACHRQRLFKRTRIRAQHPVLPPVLVSSNQPLDAVAARLQQQGLQLITSNGVVELFRDARYEQGLVAFIDARDDHHYQAGHIPGAWQFNHYRPEQYLPAVLPLCFNAQKIVVYCNGGACEDSEFAAIMLRDVGIQREKLFVYAGGITEWMSNGLPVEVGVRRSGVLKPK